MMVVLVMMMTGTIYTEYSYMHDHGIVHRDLKYENILFENPTPMANIKVIDFGLSKKFKTGVPGVMTERVGTMYVFPFWTILVVHV
jgi:serine/threonine protein kinase